MKRLRNTIFAFVAIFFLLVTPTLTPVRAGGGDVEAETLICQIFPFIRTINVFGVNQICVRDGNVENTETIGTRVSETVRLITSLIFVAIIIIAVYIIIKAAIKYIRSEGDETKIQEAQKAIKSVFIGLIALFIGIIGLVVILVIFDAVAAVNEDPVVNLENTSACPNGLNTQTGTCL